MEDKKRLITARELATYLRVTLTTIQYWSKTGKIPRVKLSYKTIRYDLEEVMAFFKDRNKHDG